jgi:hypothetical protein
MALAARYPAHAAALCERRSGHFRQAPRFWQRRNRCVVAYGAAQEPEPHAVLGVSRSASRADIRAAYYARLQEVHPDVSGADTTLEAVQLNLAYARLIGDVRARSRDAEEDGDQPSVFDAPDGEPDCIFVNPFACGVSPLQWRELQDLVIDVADPQSALEAAGLHFAYDSAVNWVTPAQLAVLTEELEAMSMDATSMDITSYYVTDCLLRAQQANNRVTYMRRDGRI